MLLAPEWLCPKYLREHIKEGISHFSSQFQFTISIHSPSACSERTTWRLEHVEEEAVHVVTNWKQKERKGLRARNNLQKHDLLTPMRPSAPKVSKIFHNSTIIWKPSIQYWSL
jgi:hypothetical protein